MVTQAGVEVGMVIELISTVAGSGSVVEGDKVEANYRGKGVYYPGKISRNHQDGTVDVDYDDGEKETGVKANLVRPLVLVCDVRRVTGFGSLLLDAPLANAYPVGTTVKVRYIIHIFLSNRIHTSSHRMLSTTLSLNAPS